jgi:hypothetical protein
MHIKNGNKIKHQRRDNPQQVDSTTYWKTSRKVEKDSENRLRQLTSSTVTTSRKQGSTMFVSAQSWYGCHPKPYVCINEGGQIEGGHVINIMGIIFFITQF